MDGPANMFCNNDAFVDNSSRLEPTLKRNSLIICYKMIIEESGLIPVKWESIKENIVDVLTKFLSGTRRRHLCGKFIV